MYVGILFPNLHKTLVGVWNQHFRLLELVWNVGEWVLRAIVRGVVSFSFSGVGVDDRQVGQVVEGQETAPGPAPDCPVGGAGPWWGVQGPAPDCPVSGVQAGWWGCMMPGDDGRGGARLPPPSSVSLPDNNKYNSVTTSNQTRQHPAVTHWPGTVRSNVV